MNEFINNIGILIQDKEILKAVLPALATVINSIITVLVAIIGFTVNSSLNRRSLINEINKHKSNKQLDKLQSLPIELLDCISLVTKNNVILFKTEVRTKEARVERINTGFLEKLNSLIDIIASYGSKEAVKLAGELTQELSIMQDEYRKNQEKYVLMEDKIKIMSYLTLLLCQIKLDLTNTIMKPSLYYRCRIPENAYKFGDYYYEIVRFNNKIVKNLKLNKSFKMKYEYKKIKKIRKIEKEKLESVKQEVEKLMKSIREAS